MTMSNCVASLDQNIAELLSVADALRSATAPQTCHSLADRLMRCREKLIGSIQLCLPPGASLAAASASHKKLAADSTSSTSTGAGLVVAPPQPLPPLTGSRSRTNAPITNNILSSPRHAVPAPPSQRSMNSTASPASSDANDNTPTRQQHTFQVKKPSSVRVAQVAREVPPPTSAGLQREIAKTISSAMYNVLESVANLTQSSSAHIFVRVGDEMVSIANVAAKLSFPPKLVRQGCQGSLAAGVTVSKIALNQRNTADQTRRQASLLIFPLKYRIDGRACQDMVPTGALQLMNKFGGHGAFTEVDENTANIASALIGEMLNKFPGIDWTEAFHDPITQHTVAPFVPRDSNGGAAAAMSLHDPDGSVFITATDPSSRKPLVDVIDGFVPPQLIRRVTLPLTQTQGTPAAVGLGAAPSLREVETYMSNLQDCWRKSVEMNVVQSQSERQRAKEMKSLRDELNFHKAKSSKIEEELRLHTLDSADYQREYTTLKDELDQYLKLKGRVET